MNRTMTENRKVTYFYVAVAMEENNGKRYARVERLSENEDITSRWVPHDGANWKPLFGQLCPTKKCAEEIADGWNDDFKAQGVYKFGR